MDELFFRGIREFNEGKFFEAHDSFEEIWQGYREPDREFLQGLIQAAVGLYHLEHQNLRGARSQFSKACSKMAPYRPEHWGLSVDLLFASLQRHLGVLEAYQERGAEGFEILDRPKIQFSSGIHQSNA
jgi:predicted metal-dependent hydrolase